MYQITLKCLSIALALLFTICLWFIVISILNVAIKLVILLGTLTLSNLRLFPVSKNAQTLSKNEMPEINRRFVSYAHSPSDLRYLTNLEKDIFLIVKEYVAKIDYEPEYFFTRYIADYESTIADFSDWNKKHTNKGHLGIYANNPLAAYRTIRRFVTDLPRIRDALISNGHSETLDAIQKTLGISFIWPDERDLNSSMDNLLNLHFVYDLNLTEFANGIVKDVATNSSLLAMHCFDISQYALTHKQFTLALEWLEMADTKRIDFNRHPLLDNVEAKSISKLMDEIIKDHDSVWMEEEDLYHYLYKMSSKHVWLPLKTHLQRQNRKGDGEPNITLNDLTAFSILCKGGNLQAEKDKSKLYCWYESKINPAWYINPQKMELHSEDPYIFQVYDFIGEDLIKYMKREATPRMKRSRISYRDSKPTTTETEQKKESKLSKERTSMTAALYEHKYKPKLPLLSRKLGYISNLIPSWGEGVASDELGISNYAPGGYCSVHLDPLKDDHWGNIGNRLASFLLYLNDVELGGNTAFTSVGVSVPPLKGSALFWYNLKRNGQIDPRTWHGGCPVLLGEKWVGHKWIHNNFNMLKRQCTLNKEE